MADLAGRRRLALRRARTWADYTFEDDGVTYGVVRETDGTLSSAVIWVVVRESDRAEVRSYTTLADLRERWAQDKATGLVTPETTPVVPPCPEETS